MTKDGAQQWAFVRMLSSRLQNRDFLEEMNDYQLLLLLDTWNSTPHSMPLFFDSAMHSCITQPSLVVSLLPLAAGCDKHIRTALQSCIQQSNRLSVYNSNNSITQLDQVENFLLLHSEVKFQLGIGPWHYDTSG